MFLVLDDFKQVNDVHGHGEGDRVVIQVARFLDKHSRASNLVARLCGDEFAMWFDGIDQDATSRPRRAHDADSVKFKEYWGDAAHPLGVSIGIAIYDPGSGESTEEIVARAKAALYKVKRQGKGGQILSEAPVE